MRTIKKVASHIFIDGFGGMTQGLFATLIIGTMIQQIGLLIGGSTGNVIYLLGKAAAALTSAGIGVGVAVKYGESPLVTVSAAVAAMVGGYAGKITGGTFFVDGNAVLAGPGEPLGAFIAAFAGITCGHLVSGKTKVDIIVTPVITIGAGSVVGLLVGPPISQMMTGLGSIINWATEQRPFIMGIVVSVVMGMVLTLPISSAALGIILNLSGLAARCRNDRLLLQHGRIRGCKLSGKQIRRPCRTGSWNLDASGAEHHASSADLAARHLLECDFWTRLHNPRQYAE